MPTLSLSHGTNAGICTTRSRAHYTNGLLGAPRGVTLLRSLAPQTVAGTVIGTRLHIQAVEPRWMSAAVFVYRRRPFNAIRQQSVDEFINIASPSDLEEYPTDTPTGDAQPPFFRLDAVDLVFPSSDEAEETWLDIFRDVTSLITTLNRMDLFGTTEPVRSGAPI